ncbi:MAG: rhomboid family intramembrane serine protease [Pedobacter sp.]|nr:rhomboid family intramembrane serine protease [Pedobacter sp.]MDQ8053585.1 rhomboid family intramembrane serine protease [Pedobacter sp.]
MINNPVHTIRKNLQIGNPVWIYIGINVVVFLLVILLGAKEQALNLFAVASRPGLGFAKIYTVFTHTFIELSFVSLAVNALWLYWMGGLLLDFTKNRQFHVIYLGGGLIGGLCYLVCVSLNLFSAASTGPLYGAYTGVVAILAAVATLIPNYSLQLMFFGFVRIKFIVGFYILLNLALTTGNQPILALAHVAAALFGFAYIKLLQNGINLSSLYKKKPKMKIVRNDMPKKSGQHFNQKEIDAILDKISKSGYENLNRAEKETLFRASNQ